MDKHSKRNRSKDNPYILTYNEVKKTYEVEFKDSNNKLQTVEISEEVYSAFDKFELEDISQIHKYRKHIEHSEVYEETLYHKAITNTKSIEEMILEKDTFDLLKEAINRLSDTQKRRIKMYYFEDMTLKDIASIEGCSIKNIHKSIELGKDNLKNYIKNKI